MRPDYICDCTSHYVRVTCKFTGKERDSESNLDHTQFRQYSSSLGRWTSPDPAGLAAVDPTNPQSWNRYAYVMNNPMNSVDPAGLSDCPDLKIGSMPSNECLSGAWCGGFGVDIRGGRNFGNGTPYVGIGGGGGQFDLPLRAFTATGTIPVEGTTWDGEPIVPWVPLYANWNLLSLIGGGGGGGHEGGGAQSCIPSVFNPSCKPPTCPAVFVASALKDLVGDAVYHAVATGLAELLQMPRHRPQ